jgi:hypothetical protein
MVVVMERSRARRYGPLDHRPIGVVVFFLQRLDMQPNPPEKKPKEKSPKSNGLDVSEASFGYMARYRNQFKPNREMRRG